MHWRIVGANVPRERRTLIVRENALDPDMREVQRAIPLCGMGCCKIVITSYHRQTIRGCRLEEDSSGWTIKEMK